MPLAIKKKKIVGYRSSRELKKGDNLVNNKPLLKAETFLKGRIDYGFVTKNLFSCTQNTLP